MCVIALFLALRGRDCDAALERELMLLRAGVPARFLSRLSPLGADHPASVFIGAGPEIPRLQADREVLKSTVSWHPSQLEARCTLRLSFFHFTDAMRDEQVE